MDHMYKLHLIVAQELFIVIVEWNITCLVFKVLNITSQFFSHRDTRDRSEERSDSNFWSFKQAYIGDSSLIKSLD